MAACFSPFSKRDELTGEFMNFPCGKCPNCLARRISGWSFRLQQHAKVQDIALFVTLTYNSDFVPISDRGFMTLRPNDLTLFMKRLRKYLPVGSSKVSYFAVGEYGGKTMRPHYHYLLFNAPHSVVERAWRVDNVSIGDIHYGEGLGINAAEVGYCLKYMSKPGKVPLHCNDDRVPEFQRCSKGIGLNYLSDAVNKWHHDDLLNRFYLPYEDGKKLAIPRYYKDKLYTEVERKLIGDFFASGADARADVADLELCLKLGIAFDELPAFKLSRDLEKIRKVGVQSSEGRFL